jgi:hypothetical protein
MKFLKWTIPAGMLALAACGGSGADGLTGTEGTGGSTGGNGNQPITSTPAVPPQGLKTASTHPMQYYVSLPKNWSTARTWPIVVTIAGSGREWTDNHAAFSNERNTNNYPFIIVTPLTITNTGSNARNLGGYNYSAATWDRIESETRCKFDFDGVKAAVADVAKNYSGQSKFFITGFSGGGSTHAMFALLHPDWLRGTASAAGNWGGRCVTGATEGPIDDPVPHPISTAPERVSLPIKFFNGTADGYAVYLLPQRDSLMALMRRNGYMSLSSQMISGAGHEPMPAQVLSFFNSTLPANER